MKIGYIILLITTAQFWANAQNDTNYVAYRNWINIAIKNVYLKKDSIAQIAYDKAFTTVVKGHPLDYILSSELYYKIGNANVNYKLG